MRRSAIAAVLMGAAALLTGCGHATASQQVGPTTSVAAPTSSFSAPTTTPSGQPVALVTSAVPARAQQLGSALPDGDWFGDVVAIRLAPDSRRLVFDPFTWQGLSTPVDRTTKAYALTWTPSTASEFWVGSSAASSHPIEGTFDEDYAQLVAKDLVTYATDPWDGYEITVQKGVITSISQVGSLTPTGEDQHFTEPS